MQNSLIIQYPIENNGGSKGQLLNNSGLPDKEAMAVFARLMDLVDRGNSFQSARIGKEENLLKLYRQSLWSEDDLKAFASLGVTPYEFKDHRTIINNLISRQRENKFKFKVVPSDVNSFRRFEKGLEKFLEEHQHEFPSIEEAKEYYNNIADDKYAQALSAYMSNVRYYSSGEYEESDTFENGIVLGAHALKAIYSERIFEGGGIDIKSVPIRALIYDELSTRYDRNDIEFVGETHEMNITELLQYWPDLREDLYRLYQSKTNSRSGEYAYISDDYQTRFQFNEGVDMDYKVKVHDMFIRVSVLKWMVTDAETGATHTVNDPMMSREEVLDKLRAGVALTMAQSDPQLGFMETQDPEMMINQIVESRFTIEQKSREMWYQAIFTREALLYWGPSKYPHQSHPYAFYYPQFTQGKYNSVLEEIADIVQALNKAYMFQELMMANSAKGLVVVNEDVMVQSGYDINEITEAYTRIGGVLVAKLKPMQKLDQFMQQVTTVGQGLGEMSRIISLYENKLLRIGGINMAQMGETPGETPTGRYKLQIAQGQQNNGVVFDNFFRTLKTFYNDKVLPLCVEDMKKKKSSVIRVIGEQHAKWINVELDDEFDLFASTVKGGQVGLMIVPDENDPQMKNTRAAQLQQLAMATGDINLYAWALKFSDDPNRHEIVRELYKVQRESQLAQMQNQVDLQMVQQIALEQGISMEVASQIVAKLQVEKMKQMQASQSGKGKQMVQGNAQIQRSASEPTRMAQIQQ